MKKLLKRLTFLFFILISVSKGNPIPIRYINELQVDHNDPHNWRIELQSKDMLMFKPLFISNQTDTAYFKSTMLWNHEYVLIIENSLLQPLSINPDGDIITLYQTDYQAGFIFADDQIRFGNVEESQVAAPLQGQSICLHKEYGPHYSLSFIYYLDNTPTWVQENDLAYGTVNGFIKDVHNRPLSDVIVSYSYVTYNNYNNETTVKSDSNGFFSFDYYSCKSRIGFQKTNYASTDTVLQIWPDSILSLSIQLADTVTGMEPNRHEYIKSFKLEQNYPNPFNAQTIIDYYLPYSDLIELAVFDINGKKIETLVSGYIHSGAHQVVWNANDCASGVYIYRLTTSEGTTAKKSMLIK